jgi:urea-proton symporter
MENIFIYSTVILIMFLGGFAFIGKTWSQNINEFLFANRSLGIISTGAAIGSHWIWAIALFVGPVIAYNWGTIGLLWFIIPNALSLVLVGYITSKIRDRYPDGFSLTEYIKQNFSSRISALYQFEFIVVSTAALLLAFTAINRLWGFTGLNTLIDSNYASLLFGLITLGFTMKGGIRTSVFTGALQTLFWIVLSVITSYYLITTDLSVLTYGKNNLQTIFDVKFLTSFALAYLITILISGTSHGHHWQKSFSMPRENIMPSFIFGALLFAVIVFSFLNLSAYMFANSFPVTSPDLASLTAISQVLGTGMFIAFGVIFISHSSTVIDSAMTYISSLITVEWLKDDSIWISRTVMLMFLLIAWGISWSKIEIWTVMMLMGAVRTVMFVPLILHIFDVRLEERVIFIVSSITIPTAVALAWIARTDKLPIYDLYSAGTALLIPLVSYTAYNLIKKN